MNILLVSGSTRSGSTNTATLRTVQAVAPEGIRTVMYEGLAGIPAFNPDHHDDGRPRHPALLDLRQHCDAADAVLFCTPEYAGSMPGSLKNLLDWTVGGGELYHKPVAWINVAAPGRGGAAAASLASVLGYVDAVVVESACLDSFVARDAIGPDGLVTTASVRTRLVESLQALAAHVAGASA